MPGTHVNVHGRRGTRGWRPYLLVPKVLSVAALTGGWAAVAVLYLQLAALPPSPEGEARRVLLQVIGRLVLTLIVPAAAAAMVLGVLLTLAHPRQFLRLRWLQVKLVLILVGAPLTHLWMSSRLVRWQAATAAGQTDSATQAQFGWGLLVVLAGLVVLIVLGRQKPRLGQNWARDYARSQAGTPSPASGDQES